MKRLGAVAIGLALVAPGAGAIAATTAVPAGTITTVAGGIGGPGPATTVALSPCRAVFTGGQLYVTDRDAVRAVSSQTDELTTPAGPVTSDAGGDGALATSVGLTSSCGITADRAGNVLIGTVGFIRVLALRTGRFYGRAMTKGHLYAIAKIPPGPCTCDSSLGLAVDQRGNVVFSERFANKVVVLAASSGLFYGQRMKAGHQYTVAGTGRLGRAGDGGPATRAGLRSPDGVAVDRAGNLVIADTSNSRIRVVAERTGRFYGVRMRPGDIYTVVDRNGVWWKGGFGGDGGPAISATIDHPSDVEIDRTGNLIFVDSNNKRIRVVAARSGTFYAKAMRAGRIYTVAGGGKGLSGDGGPAGHAGLFPSGVTVDGSGNLVISDLGRVRVVAASDGTFYDRAMRPGFIYTVAGISDPSGVITDGSIASQVPLDQEYGLTVDAAGNVIFALMSAVYVIDHQEGTFYGRPMRPGQIYRVAGNGTEGALRNGGPATDTAIVPLGITPDRHGNLVVTDLLNHLVRVVAASSGTFYGQAMNPGSIYTIAGGGTGAGSGDGGPATSATLKFPAQVAVDSAGNLVFGDEDRVRVLPVTSGTYYGQAMTADDIYTIAGTGVAGFSADGTTATQARIDGAEGLAIDSSGNVVFSDWGNERIRVVATGSGTFYGRAMTAGRIYTIAGGGTHGLGDGGPATGAQLNAGWNIAIDGHGNVVIPDQYRVRVVALASGTFYGVPMAAGHIYTVAGLGRTGFSGDGGPGRLAALEYPQSVAVDAAGNLLIGDEIRIRSVTG